MKYEKHWKLDFLHKVMWEVNEKEEFLNLSDYSGESLKKDFHIHLVFNFPLKINQIPILILN